MHTQQRIDTKQLTGALNTTNQKKQYVAPTIRTLNSGTGTGKILDIEPEVLFVSGPDGS
ncbi:MAG: hypothetical protein WCS87_15045 [Methylococcaceae bacterium]